MTILQFIIGQDDTFEIYNVNKKNDILKMELYLNLKSLN